MLDPKGYLNLAAIAIAVLVLWLLFGFIVPFYLFKSLDDGGKFGDGFGSINSLFTGIGFVAVAYTIYNQQGIIKDQKRQEKFSVALGLVGDIKDDLKNLQFEGATGPNAILTLMAKFASAKYSILDTFFTSQLVAVLIQMNSSADYIRKYFKKSEEEEEIIIAKLISLYAVNFLRLMHQLRGMTFTNKEFLILQILCITTMEKLYSKETADEIIEAYDKKKNPN